MAKDTLDQLFSDGCSEVCGPKDNFILSIESVNEIEEVKEEFDNIMGAPCAQEIIGWQGQGTSPSLTAPTQ